MFQRSFFFLALPVLLSSWVARVSATACNVTTPCPASAPCCSEFGFCGTGYFCLGGCNPFASRSVESCKPAPLCQDKTYTFNDPSRILTNYTLFDGNATAHDWLVENGDILSQDGALVMTLNQKNLGTRLTTTRYVHYGTITARLKAGRWGGVVTAFITMSDIKDEIDWEWPGAKTDEVQSNFFWQGNIPTDRTNGDKHGGLSDVSNNFHDYTIDWQPDTLTFAIDGQVVRTVQRSAATGSDGVSRYPSTPSRVQLSIWPAGVAGTPPGTVDWAGGMIDWNNPDYKAAGHFYAVVQSVTVKCTNAQRIDPSQNITSYVYGGAGEDGKSKTQALMNKPVVVYSNRTTLLKGAAGGSVRMGSAGVTGAAMVVGCVGALVALLL